MVNVDELNEHIEKFGAATNKLNEISSICDDFDEAAKQIADTCSKQEEIVANQEKSNTELRTWLDVTLKTTESHLMDKIALQENRISEMETKLKESEKSLTDKIEAQDKSIQELSGNVKTLKTLVIITLICSIIAVGATVLMHYI